MAAIAILAMGGAGGSLLLAGNSSPSRDAGKLKPAADAATTSPSTSPSTSASPRAEQAGYGDFAALYAAKSGAIVRLTASGCNYDSVGTGFFVDAHHIATVGHVVAGASSISAVDGTVTIPVKVVGTDIAQDVALLYTPTAWSGPTVALQAAPAQVGTSVAALGFPKGLPLSLSRGSVSAVDQTLTDGVISQHGLVQTDTPLNHGNSGGPLMTLDGTAVGLVDSGRIDANNISYAVGSRIAQQDFAGWPDNGNVPPVQCNAYTGTPYDPTLLGPADSGASGYKPYPTDPGATDPGATDPGATDPGATDPGATDPGATDPGTVDPAAADPSPSDPATTDSGMTGPSSSDPTPSDSPTPDPGTVNDPSPAAG